MSILITDVRALLSTFSFFLPSYFSFFHPTHGKFYHAAPF